MTWPIEIIQEPNIAISYVFCFSSIISATFVLIKQCREWAIKLTAIFLIGVIALIANNIGTYIASLFIIATLFTERTYLLTLIAIMRGDKRWIDFERMQIKGEINPPTKDKPKREKNAMEYRILNTLWTKQVNYYPDYSKIWGFTINVNSIDYIGFREATDRLIGEELIFAGEQGMYFLTKKGIQFCVENYNTFLNPDDQYWPDEKMKNDNLIVAVKEAEKL